MPPETCGANNLNLRKSKKPREGHYFFWEKEKKPLGTFCLLWQYHSYAIWGTHESYVCTLRCLGKKDITGRIVNAPGEEKNISVTWYNFTVMYGRWNYYYIHSRAIFVEGVPWEVTHSWVSCSYIPTKMMAPVKHIGAIQKGPPT